MAELTVQQVSKTGIADLSGALAAADANGDEVQQASGLVIVMQNGDASPHTLTLSRPAATVDTDNYGDATISDLTLVVAAGDFGLLTVPPGYGANNKFSWTYDAVTSVNIGVFSLAP